MISVDRIRQQPSGSPELGEHCRSSTMPPACASAWRMSAVHHQQGRSSTRRVTAAEAFVVSLMNGYPNACRSRLRRQNDPLDVQPHGQVPFSGLAIASCCARVSAARPLRSSAKRWRCYVSLREQVPVGK
jgi:hypothetical protein